MTTLEQITQHKIVAILRGVQPENVLKVANALYAGGIRILEVTLNSKDPFTQIELLDRELGKKMLIGAGTVVDIEGAKAAIQSGARFLISPIVNVEVIKVAKDNGLVSIPGAYTATEIFFAHKSGGDIIKVFPASDPGYLKGLQAALDHLRLMPTGGVNLNNIMQFYQAGSAAFGIGSALVNKATNLDDQYLNGLTEKARSFVRAIEITQ